jgi:formylglycine-generating enzyme required for sulfatase activity
MRLVRIPAGSFQMGSPDLETGRNSDEGPVHTVTLSSDFYLGETEVTQAQWLALAGINPASGYGVGNDYPVYDVSWNDIASATGFLAELNALGKGIFRLPSEAEWEYACRGGTTTRFSFGDSLGCPDDCTDCAAGSETGNRSDYMWYCWSGGPDGSPVASLPVASLLPNPFGLYDMHGNLWEWCQDGYHDSFVGAPNDGSAWENFADHLKVYRGGSWNYSAASCRSANRNKNLPTLRSPRLGFRLVLTP